MLMVISSDSGHMNINTDIILYLHYKGGANEMGFYMFGQKQDHRCVKYKRKPKNKKRAHFTTQ